MTSDHTRQSPIGIARVTEAGFPLTRFLVPQLDEVSADSDGQCLETKKPEPWHDTCLPNILEDS